MNVCVYVYMHTYTYVGMCPFWGTKNAFPVRGIFFTSRGGSWHPCHLFYPKIGLLLKMSRYLSIFTGLLSNMRSTRVGKCMGIFYVIFLNLRGIFYLYAWKFNKRVNLGQSLTNLLNYHCLCDITVKIASVRKSILDRGSEKFALFL